MPKKTPRQKKQVQVSDEDSSDQQRTLRKVQNKARQTRAQNCQFAALDMEHPALPGPVGDDQQRPVQQPAHRTIEDYTALRVSGFLSAIAPPGIDSNSWELKTGRTTSFREG
ncbi:unnamed protein product [Rhodiola kirilowii]